MEALRLIQQELKAPKGQYNSFGKYHYRSCEDIVESVKPLLAKHGVQLTLTDDIVMVGDRIYVKATATLYDEKGVSETATAFAREPEQKKGMDESQITGTASSYARKYALNGLFLIDDTKDPDTDEYRNQQNSAPIPAAVAKISKAQADEIINLSQGAGVPVVTILKGYKISKLEDMTAIDAGKTINTLKKRIADKMSNGQ